MDIDDIFISTFSNLPASLNETNLKLEMRSAYTINITFSSNNYFLTNVTFRQILKDNWLYISFNKSYFREICEIEGFPDNHSSKFVFFFQHLL